jgi:hypothetical protein
VIRRFIYALPIVFFAGCGGAPETFLPPRQLAAVEQVTASSDSLAVSGYRSDFTLTRAPDGTVTVKNTLTGQTQSAAGVKVVKFFDKYTSFDADGLPGQVYRLYQAALNRDPDAAGLGFWTKQSADGLSLPAIADLLIQSDEFGAAYGRDIANKTFVNILYNNILRRDGEQTGVDWWANALATGLSRSQVLLGFSESTENRSNVAVKLASGFDYVPYEPAAAQASCANTPPERPLRFAHYNLSTNEWNLFDAQGLPKAIPFAFTECISGRNLADSAISAEWNWSLPQADWRYPEGPNNTDGWVKAFPEIIYGRQLYGSSSEGAVLPALVKNVDIVANYDLAVETDGLPLTIQQTFLQGTYISTADSNEWLTSVTVMLMPTKVCMEKTCGNPQDFIERTTIDGIAYRVYRLIDVDSRTNLKRYNVELLVDENHLRGSMKLRSINDYLISKGWLQTDNYMNSVELGTEVISGAGKTTVKHFSITRPGT